MPNEMKDRKREKYETSWSVSENSIYITNTHADDHVLTIQFKDELTRLSQQQKLDLLQELITGLKQTLTLERSIIGY